MTGTHVPGTGFTGVDWDLRSSEQLATDLGTGPGPAPLAEAGLAWARLATEIGEAGVEYAAVLARLGLHWRAAHTSTVFDRLTQLVPWFAETASEAAENSARAEAQAAATTVARLNMPDLAEVDVVERLHEIAAGATAVAPIMAGAAAEAERAVVQQRMRAARVMQAYENATEPVGKPWPSSRRAPELVSGQALAAEKAAAARAAAPRPVAAPHMPVVPPLIGGVGGGAAYTPPIEKIRLAPTVAAGATPQAVASATSAAGATTSAGAGMPPPIAPGVAAAAGDRGASARSVSVESGAAVDDIPESRATEHLDGPVSWADVEAADKPVVHHVSDSAPRTVDPRYLEERFLLGNPGDRP
ncbi:PPE domain-containing protein [Gordonia aurantiaca]|uniref:PPE domain-containing protein n=1 Tax=Gordonia sp. B21 TaxID=3151852 RepID=UPI00326563BE